MRHELVLGVAQSKKEDNGGVVVVVVVMVVMVRPLVTVYMTAIYSVVRCTTRKVSVFS